ncbi:hypothetical protein BGZ98_002931 [Dissophora globulifera]|nr:hypothetical protein BGZ98_002931 [Dissophora globulifera]
MSSLLGDALALDDLPKARPSEFLHAAPSATSLYANGLEVVMTDSAVACTPPLDLESDSDDDELDHSLRSPVLPPTLPLASVHQRKRKDSLEHGGALHLLDRNHGANELGHPSAPPPALDHRGKGAQGRRPTVTFDLDHIEQLSPPARPSVRFALESVQLPAAFRHDDDDDVDESDRSDTDCQDKTRIGAPLAQSNSDTRNNVHQVEQEFRRVSISLAVDSDDHHDDTTSDTSIGLPAKAPVDISPAPPQEVILDHVLTDAAPQDMLVALFDRPSELKALAARHSDFFNVMYNSLSLNDRDRFKTVLYLPREELSDSDWMHAIADQLGPLSPCILEKFKGIVGWIGPDSEDDEMVLWGEDEYGYRDSSFEHVQIKWLRDIEDFTLEAFQQGYPQFFVNAREQLQGRRMSCGGDHRDRYAILCETLGLTKSELPCDNAWARRMNSCLDKYPELLLQLKEIIAYEVGYDD